MKFDACPVEPPGSGNGPLSSSTMSRQPCSARWYTSEFPTMPAPMTTALARSGTSLMIAPWCCEVPVLVAVLASTIHPGTRGVDLVERVDMQSGERALAGTHPGTELADEPFRVVPERVAEPAQERAVVSDDAQ